MASTASKIRELRDSNQSRGSDLERVAGHVPVSLLDQPDAHCPNGQVGRDLERTVIVLFIVKRSRSTYSVFPHCLLIVNQIDHSKAQLTGIPISQKNSRNSNKQSKPERRLLPSFLFISALIALEVGILAMHCQGSSTFDTHPANSWTFVFVMFIHFGAALYNIKCFLPGSRFSNICDLAGYISGSLASAAFLSILVPPSLIPLVYIIWMLQWPVYIDVARNCILKGAKRLCGYLSNGIVHVQNIWNLEATTKGSNQSAKLVENFLYKLSLL